MDSFLMERTMKQLQSWCTTKVNSTRRGIIVNNVFLASIIFFAAIWDGTLAGVRKVTSSVQGFMWSGSTHRARTKVAWIQCCQIREKGSINMVNPKDTLIALMLKWVLKGCKPSTSNLHIFLRYRISSYQPYFGVHWKKNMEFFLVVHSQVHKGLTAWNKVGTSWKKLVLDMCPVLPKTPEEVDTESFWWLPHTPQIGPRFSKARACQLYKKGLRLIRDAQCQGRLISTPEAQEKFGLKEGE